MKKEKPNTFIKNIAITVLGGMGLLIATVLMTSFISAPPSRAEFDSLKVETSLHYKEIKDNLTTLKQGQTSIINHLIQKGKK